MLMCLFLWSQMKLKLRVYCMEIKAQFQVIISTRQYLCFDGLVD